MKLPNGDRAELGDKLERYSLNYEHQKGKHKALLFEKRLGITLANKEILEQALQEAKKKAEQLARAFDDVRSAEKLVADIYKDLFRKKISIAVIASYKNAKKFYYK